ncbi:hypothetical protein AA23498_1971 [Acetobacter nitrogenifigens DSM 23921 = NBRC 105050]|uniref:DUF6538 domain-containing protein n=1 Tax=Acetobacter nitrogenifigens DSM 23921 = NBRC 105050 TaxID=1120919 RepID=A0A511XFF4_9PROT|nr:DUF6538 domain-containing protein [Acetobacter nitrogenifigens]GBQ94255.1 hypothetical protein AA23498_1971 [Acetobacter nitrogenifigens DSM 23921 = NBRC 105050]GEN61692.1 hypothetical protein ANI02nite_35760 [Acetobacter nitrogenifigens DSM 23921 = NBRC 105050]
MLNIFRRGHSWAVRFHIPRERREDVGKAYGAATGHKAEIVKALGTSDRAEAIARRPKALEAIRQEVDAKLVAAADRETTRVGHVRQNELHPGLLKPEQEVSVTTQAVELGDQQLSLRSDGNAPSPP